MAKLRLLVVHYTRIPKGPDYLPNELRWINWDKYPSNYLPTTFEADILVGLRLHRSGLRQLWEGRTISNVHAFDTKKSVLKFTLEKFEYLSSWWQSPMPPVLPLTQWFVRDLQELVGRVLAFELRNLVIKKMVYFRLNSEYLFYFLPLWFNIKFGGLMLISLKLGQLEIGMSKITLHSSSQSPTSIFQSLFQLRKRQKTTRSLVLAPIWDLTSLTSLDLTDCNLMEGAIPGELGSLFSLENLCLGGNDFENLPSLNRLSQLAHLELNRCTMLRELPELPSRIRRLFANDCASLRVSADRFAMCKIEFGWFRHCRKLLDYGESEIVASTLLQQLLQLRQRSFSLGPFDCWITDVQVELMICDDRSHPMLKEAIFLRNTGNITCLEHTIMGFKIYDKLVSHVDPWNSDAGKIEVSMRSLSPGTVVVKKWGIRLLFNDDHEEEFAFWSVQNARRSYARMYFPHRNSFGCSNYQTRCGIEVARFLDLSHLLITQLDPTPTPFPKDSLGTFANKGFKLGIPLHRVIDVDKASIDSNQLVEVHRNNLEDSDIKRSQIYASFSLPHYKLRPKVVKQLRLYVRKNVECGKMQEEGPKKKSISILKPEKKQAAWGHDLHPDSDPSLRYPKVLVRIFDKVEADVGFWTRV
ncbi:hypothetical protein LguiA_007273 [Lonicera macranthoides]